MPVILAAIVLIGLLAALSAVIITNGLDNVGEILTGPIGWAIGITLVLATALGGRAGRKMLPLLKKGPFRHGADR